MDTIIVTPVKNLGGGGCVGNLQSKIMSPVKAHEAILSL